MFKQIVVGVDEHEGGRDAVALAQRLLAPDGELTLAYVYADDSHVYRGASPAYEESEHERARELLEKAREEVGVEAHLRWRRSSSAGRGLHELCEAIGADLLVVGSSRRGLLGRVLIGDDTRSAPCAIAIAPAGYSQQPAAMREIGVGYDGSPESEHAVAVARALAAQCGAKLSAFEAVSLPTYAFVGGPAPMDGVLEGLVDDARERIAALGGVEPHAAYGVAVEELAVYSASLDLLVVGSRGYGPVGRLVHGSTSQQLAHSARCPLLVLTRASRTTGANEPAEDGRDTTVALKR
ncbi:MAG: universal stress protein [Solirubrobacteraceae bacterium]